mmetsp:Transcript_29065/g.25705  ORF Transcript_29065/g.25705 Transcript_29065/m.25705 type:complete len:187 (+) Transcript_29065:643-1203(+)
MSINWNGPNRSAAQSYLETPIINFNVSNYIEKSFESHDLEGKNNRSTVWAYKPNTVEYPTYLDEDRNFTYVANWAKANSKGRMPTYVTHKYRDDRAQPRRSSHYYKNSTGKATIKSARNYVNQMNTSHSTEDYTKRKVRRGHFKADEIEVEVYEVDLFDEDEEGNRSSKHIRSKTFQDDLGYWCPN